MTCMEPARIIAISATQPDASLAENIFFRLDGMIYGLKNRLCLFNVIITQ